MKYLTIFAFSTFLCILLCGHDLFLKTDAYYLPTETLTKLFLFNGTFDKSENIITRDRIIDASVVGPDMEFTPSAGNWFDKDNSTFLQFKTGKTGTYVVGISTASKNIELSAKDFNEYLEHDGVLDELEARQRDGMSKNDAIEKYSKHVKCIIQVGDGHTQDYQTELDYPIEFILKDNPSTLKAGDNIGFMLLRSGKPLGNQLVYYGHRTGDEKIENHVHDTTYIRTDQNGNGNLNLEKNGIWYLRTIHMERHADPDLDYESNWATINFEIR